MRTFELSIRYLSCLALLAPACSMEREPLAPDPELGSYVLKTLDGQELPARAPCKALDVLGGTILLQTGRSATASFQYAWSDSGDELSYSGSGTFRRDGNILVLDLQGTWSNQSAADGWRMALEIRPGELRRVSVGAECDANSTEVYRLQSVPPA